VQFLPDPIFQAFYYIERKHMLVMPANSTGWFWHCLARETGRIGHLFSPGAERGPWPWFPYALDNGAFSCWDQKNNIFDEEQWSKKESGWRNLIYWASNATQRPLWAIVPDTIGSAEATFEKWSRYQGYVRDAEIPAALAVQDGMTVEQVKQLKPGPSVICVGGTTEWKWQTIEMWAKNFPHVHLLRCNSPEKLDYLESLGVKSCDGTGWNRGDKKQTEGLEVWARKNPEPKIYALTPYSCRQKRNGQQEWAWF
jgi:hypothetical protein